LSRTLETEPSPQMRELVARLREEVEQRASLGASLIPSAATPTIAPLSVLEVPLIGRQEEFGALVSEYQAARMGQTRVVAILGEAGIGKTRVAEEFLGWSKSRGADVLEGGASDGGGLPYGPLIEAIRPRLERGRAPDDLLEHVWLSELSRLLPELNERYPDLPTLASSEAETAKGALFEAIARTVQALVSRAPVVLFLDDLQWADTATLEVIDYATKHWAEQGASVLVLIAARPEEPEAGSAFERWLSSLRRRLPLRSLILGLLGDEDVEELLERLAFRAGSLKPPAEALEEPGVSNGVESELKRFGEQLAAETVGHPFYLVETLKALLEEGKLLLQRSHADGETVVEVGPALRAERSALSGLLPKSVREVIHVRLSHVSPAGSELLGAGAVLERGFDFETLVSVADLGEAESLRALDELIERHLLREEAGGREVEMLLDPTPTYTFTHAKIRQVAYTEAGHARRRLLHRRAFEVLEESGAPAAQLARHALAGGLAEPAFGYSVAAGDAAMEVFAAKDAIEHYERASKLLAEDEVRSGARQLAEPSIPHLEHLYAQLGRAYELSREWGKARAAYETMLALGRQLGEASLEALSLNHLAILTFPHQQEIDAPRAETLLEEARGVAEKAGLEEELVETECNLADLMTLWAGDYEHSSPLARKALASARVLEKRPDLVARALGTLAWVELNRGRYEESAAYAEEGAELNRELARRPAPQALLPSMGPTAMGLLASWRAGTKTMEIRCLTILAADRILQGRLRGGIKIAREALGIISRELPEGAEALGLLALGIGLVEIGEYEEALKLCRRGTEVARKTSDVFLLWFNLDNLGRTYEALLDLEEARRVHEEALKLGVPLGSQYEAVSYIRLCAVAVLSEEWEEAYAHAKRAYQGSISFRTLEALYLYYYEVEALLRGGEERSAREEVHRFAERAEANERARISYLRSLAVLSQWEGDHGRAIEHLQEAQVLAENIGLPKELWQIQSRLGELHERRGEEAEAREAYSLAAQTLRELAQKIADEELRERFLSAPLVRRVLGHQGRRALL
jgi:tetratricopeptide (TPR) repeat protein